MEVTGEGGLKASLFSSIPGRPGMKTTGHIHAINMSHETDGQTEGAKGAGVHSSSDGQAQARTQTCGRARTTPKTSPHGPVGRAITHVSAGTQTCKRVR